MSASSWSSIDPELSVSNILKESCRAFLAIFNDSDMTYYDSFLNKIKYYLSIHITKDSFSSMYDIFQNTPNWIFTQADQIAEKQLSALQSETIKNLPA